MIGSCQHSEGWLPYDEERSVEEPWNIGSLKSILIKDSDLYIMMYIMYILSKWRLLFDTHMGIITRICEVLVCLLFFIYNN